MTNEALQKFECEDCGEVWWAVGVSPPRCPECGSDHVTTLIGAPEEPPAS